MKKIKCKTTDFEYTDLPKNRTLVFFDIIKNQWRKLLGLGFILLLGFIPFIAIIFFRDNYLMGVYSSLSKIFLLHQSFPVNRSLM